MPDRLLRVGSFSINDEHKIFEESQHEKDPNELLGHPHISFYFIQLLVWRNMAGKASKGFGLDATRINILLCFLQACVPWLKEGGFVLLFCQRSSWCRFQQRERNVRGGEAFSVPARALQPGSIYPLHIQGLPNTVFPRNTWTLKGT